MSVRYVNFKHYKRGVPNTNSSSSAKYRNCMHCTTRAYWTAVKRTPLIMEVRLCEEDKLRAEEVNERSRA